jgi:drug/metabolite transporter (DMT)-like permease
MFRFAGQKGMAMAPVLFVNYVVSFAFSLVVTQNWPQPQWWMLSSALLGFLFMVVFQVIAHSTNTAGVGSTATASKLSMVWPILAFSLLFGEWPKPLQWVGITLVLSSVLLPFFTARQSSKSWILPLTVFLSTGLVDTLIALHGRPEWVAPEHKEALFTFIFGFAAATALFQSRNEMQALQKPSIWGLGLVLGLINYGSLFFLLSTLQSGFLSGSTFFPVNNMGVIALTSLAGVLLFHERPKGTEWLALVLGLLGLLCILWFS